MAKNKTLEEMLVLDPTLLDGITLPSGLTLATLKELILERSELLCPWIQSSARLKADVTLWSTYRTPDWARALQAMTEQYNPIYNYFRKELGKEQTSRHKGTKTERTIEEEGAEENAYHKGSKTSSSEEVKETPGVTTTNTGSVVAYDSNVEAETGNSVQTHLGYNTRELDPVKNYVISEDLDATHYDREVKTFDDRKTTITETITDAGANEFDKDTLEFIDRITEGNIGVTQNVDMILNELKLRFENSIYERIAAEFEDKFMMQVY